MRQLEWGAHASSCGTPEQVYVRCVPRAGVGTALSFRRPRLPQGHPQKWPYQLLFFSADRS